MNSSSSSSKSRIIISIAVVALVVIGILVVALLSGSTASSTPVAPVQQPANTPIIIQPRPAENVASVSPAPLAPKVPPSLIPLDYQDANILTYTILAGASTLGLLGVAAGVRIWLYGGLFPSADERFYYKLAGFLRKNIMIVGGVSAVFLIATILVYYEILFVLHEQMMSISLTENRLVNWFKSYIYGHPGSSGTAGSTDSEGSAGPTHIPSNDAGQTQ